MLEQVVIVRFSHGGERYHRRESSLESVGERVHGRQRRIARLDQIAPLARRQSIRQGHEAGVVKAVD